MSRRKNGVMNALAAGIALISLAPPAVAETAPPVRIGVLDMQAKRLIDKDANVRVVYREFVAKGAKAGHRMTPTGRDHGEVVLTSAVREIRRIDRSVKIEVYSANAFEMKADGTGYAMKFDKGVEALRWMKQNGVTVVSTSFNTTNENGSRFLIDEAERLGMTVFAGSSNVAGAGKVFPAADERTISIADTTPSGSSLTLDPSVQEWVKFGIRGDYADAEMGGAVTDWGSSYASAKAAGYGAYLASRNPEVSRIDIETALRATSKIATQRYGKFEATIQTLGLGDMPQSFKNYCSVPRSASVLIAHGPSATPVSIAVASLQR